MTQRIRLPPPPPGLKFEDPAVQDWLYKLISMLNVTANTVINMQGSHGPTPAFLGGGAEDGVDDWPLPGVQGLHGEVGPIGPMGFGLDGQDGLDGMSIAGTPGTTGLPGPVGFGWDGDDGQDGVSLPGVAGPQGPTGPALFLPGDPGEEGPAGPPGLADPPPSWILAFAAACG